MDVTNVTCGCIHCDLGRPLIENTMDDREFYPYLHRDENGRVRICDKHSKTDQDLK